MENSKTNQNPNDSANSVIEPEVIDAKNVSVEGEETPYGNINIEHDDIESSSVRDLIKNGSIGFFEYIIEFEEDHPWIFFIGVALTLFVILGGLISIFFGDSMSFDFFSNDGDISINISELPEEKKLQTSYKAAINGLESGFLLTSKEKFDEIVYGGESNVFLGDEFTFIQQLNNALSVDIQSILKGLNKDERLNKLREYLVYLIKLEKKGSNNFIKLNTVIKNLEKEKSSYKAKKEASNKKVNTVFEVGGANELTKALKELNQYEDEYDMTDNKLILARQIIGLYKKPLQLTQARIAAIRANKDILLLGLQVFSIDQAGLDLIKSDSVNDWYSSEVPMSGRNTNISNYKYIRSDTESTRRNFVPKIITEDTLNSVMNRR